MGTRYNEARDESVRKFAAMYQRERLNHKALKEELKHYENFAHEDMKCECCYDDYSAASDFAEKNEVIIKQKSFIDEVDSFIGALDKSVIQHQPIDNFNYSHNTSIPKPEPTLPPLLPIGEDYPSSAHGSKKEDAVINENLFNLARQKHDALALAWGNIVSDPLNALTHAALFDVSTPKTAAFIETYGEAQDLESILRNCDPTPAQAERYYKVVKRSEVLWNAAFSYAERVNYSWLPAGEQANARKADKLLRMAADESLSFTARMNYTKKAAALMEKIHTVVFPAETHLALENTTMLALETKGSN